MKRETGMKNWIKLAIALLGIAIGAVALAPAAGAAEDPTVWMCKPGETPNPCEGPLDGSLTGPDNVKVSDLGYEIAQNPAIDCFYVYPTQSEQQAPNADFSKDGPLRGATINQARQFSRTCRVFAPVYRQYTNWALAHPDSITAEVRDLAYDDVKAAWENYLERYNDGRGVIVIGHSQGTSHLARLVQKEIDPVAAVRKRIISAYLIGANVFVPKGKLVGGQFQHIPACETGSQTGCVVAYSAFQNRPAADSMFGRVDVGYWVHPDPRPDPAKYEVLCVNPAGITGEGGKLRPLANLTAFVSPDAPEGERPWIGSVNSYTAECRNEDGASWLQVNGFSGGTSLWDMLVEQVGSKNGDNPNGNLHVADVNLALDNLVALAGTQSAAWLERDAKQRGLVDRRNKLRSKLAKAKRQVKKARAKCRKAKRSKRLSAKAKRRVCKRVPKQRARVRSLQRQLTQLNRRID